MSEARPSTVPPIGAAPLGLLLDPPLGLLLDPLLGLLLDPLLGLLLDPPLGLLMDPLLVAPLPAAEGAIVAVVGMPSAEGAIVAVVGMPAAPGAWPAAFAPYGTAAVLHADSIPAAPRTPAPSSTQRRVAQ
jgi:hypothetical protein